jgi:hypothetical protein
MASWWADKSRQVGRHLRARVTPAERAGLETWRTPAELGLFDAMHVADRRHGLDVVARLRAEGVDDTEVLVAGLLHDCAKGDTGVLPRIAFSLGERYGAWIPRVARVMPAARRSLERLRVHADASAALAVSAGCSPRTVELIRHQDAPVDPVMGRLLKLADEAS